MRAFVLALAVAILPVAAASAQNFAQQAGLYAPSVWDLKLREHAAAQRTDEYVNFACGTNGGPPSQPLRGWNEFARCARDPVTGLHEVYFQYDDEAEYWARAHALEVQINLYQYTSAYAVPVIASALFDDEGFLKGIRLVTDPRVPAAVRENAASLSGYLNARYGDDGWTCEDLPRLPGENEFRGVYLKRQCRKDAGGLALLLETRQYRKVGQGAIDPNTALATSGQFEISTRFEFVDGRPLVDVERATAATALAAASAAEAERTALVARARNCSGCDLRGANLKRADLSGANLAGANLSGANLHGAVLAGAMLEAADLANANLNRADIKRAVLRGATLTEAMLFEARLDAADLSNADLTSAYAGKVQLINARLHGAKLVAVDLRNARLNDADFRGADLTGSWFHESRMERAVLVDAQLDYAVMWRANMVEAKLGGALVRDADLFGANLRGADLTNADFSYSRLTSVNFSEAILTGAVWEGAELPAGFHPEAIGK